MTTRARPRTGAYVRTSPWVAGMAAFLFAVFLLRRLAGPAVDDTVAGALGHGLGWGLLPGVLVAIGAHIILWYAVLKRARVDGTPYYFGMWAIVIVCSMAANAAAVLLRGG